MTYFKLNLTTVGLYCESDPAVLRQLKGDPKILS